VRRLRNRAGAELAASLVSTRVRARVAGAVLVAGVGAVLGGACGGPTGEVESRAAQVYVATIRDVVADLPAAEDPEAVPVVYVVGVGERAIPADVQAEVAAELDGDVDIRFADQRTEAVLEGEEKTPVRDEGVLLGIGELADDANPVELPVEIYWSEDDWSKVIFTLARRSSQWTVTSSSVLPVDS
jgi:hypothetical protein